jgi:hypothetical protein
MIFLEVEVNIRSISSNAVRVEKVSNDELFKILPCDLSVSILVDDLDVGSDVGCGGLEALVHGTVAVDKPFGNFNGLADSISISIICFYYFSKSVEGYLAKLRHSSLVKSPPFSMGV